MPRAVKPLNCTGMFDLDRYLSERRERIERELANRLPPPDAQPVQLGGALRHAIMAGGKRLRPILCLAAAEAAGGLADAAMPAALAVELLHGYTLVHDDLPCMDDDDERRGMPTVHVAYGEAAAVLAGDALQALAFESLALTREARPGILAEMVRALGCAAYGVVAGQVEDVRKDREPDRDTIAYVHEHKTADLFAAALKLGALSAGGDPRVVGNLESCGRHLGLAFQILDDLLDAPEGSCPATDSELNCLSITSPEEARRQAARHTREAIEALADCPGVVEPIRVLAERLLTRTQ